ncbi:MAG: FkbM family methyltransferase [Thiobacillaceae bacterium]
MDCHSKNKSPEHLIRQLLTILSDRIDFPKNIVDVGANINASISSPFIDSGWDCILIEPQNYCANVLARVYSGNRRVKVLRCACSDTNGELKLFHGRDGAGSELATLNSGNDPWLSAVRDPDSFEVVPVRTLDSLLSGHPSFRNLGILKIDTESFDYHVLSGLDLDVYKPKIIVTEEYLWDIDSTISKHRLLERSGYINIGWVEYNTIWCRGDYFSLTWSECEMRTWLQKVGRPVLNIDQVSYLHTIDKLLSRSNTFEGILRELNLLGTLQNINCSANQVLSVSVVLANLSAITVPSLPTADGTGQILVSHHCTDEFGNMKIWDGLRTPLPADINPGEAIVMDVAVVAPPCLGRYFLQIDLVVENRGWLSQHADFICTCVMNVI